MTIAVLGAGVIGVTTAYYLAKAGERVVVIDRQPQVAAETSFANAGLVSPGHAYAWASPRAPMILLQSLWRDDTALKFKLRFDPRMWGWGLKFLANCTAEANRRNTLVKLRLCNYAQAALADLAAAENIAYHRTTRGCLYLFRDPAHFATGQRNMALLNDHGGLGLRAVAPDELARIEPALAGAARDLVGAIHAPKDETGDCRLFTERLADLCRDRGVAFRLAETIIGLERDGDRIAAIHTDRGRLAVDRVVVALGSYANQLTETVGVKLPVYPVKGYSLTFPLRDPARAPSTGGVDEGYLVAFSRQGDALRLTATADFAGYDTSHRPEQFATMVKVGRALFPEAADYTQPRYWACLRPMTPDGPPILGATRIVNLFLNAGSGHMGWSMACGNARIVTDLILGRKPELPLDGLTLEGR